MTYWRSRAGTSSPRGSCWTRRRRPGDPDVETEGFQVGANDYLTKPFAVRELLARVKALGRRATSVPAEPEVVDRGDVGGRGWLDHDGFTDVDETTACSPASDPLDPASSPVSAFEYDSP